MAASARARRSDRASAGSWLGLLAAVLLVTGCVGGDVEPIASQAPGDAPQEPDYRLREHEAVYSGPGREAPEPTDVDEVLLGWFGPSDPAHPDGGDPWVAATMAIEEANAAGGHEGRPFRLLPAWSEDPWGTGIRDVTRLAYEDRVWALVGSPDGPSAHLVEQVTAKARLPFVNPLSTDKSTNLANVPWIFSCAPGDHLLAPVLAEVLVARTAGRPFALVSCTDHDSRLTTKELQVALERSSAWPAVHLEFRPDALDHASRVAALREGEAAAIALIAGPQASARFVTALRSAGLDLPVIAGPAAGRRAFVVAAGAAAEGVLFPLLWNPADSDTALSFSVRFESTAGRPPDYSAAYAYDAMRLLIEAVRRAGLNRARIRDALREIAPWHGVTGEVVWDPTGHRLRHVGLGVWKDGRVAPLVRR